VSGNASALGQAGTTEPGASSAARGYSLLEIVFVLGLAVTITGIAIPKTAATVEEVRAAGAARYISARLQRARMEAIARSTDVGLQFVLTDGKYTYGTYVDGNANGIRTREIETGVDRQVAAPERLSEEFRGVDFGVLPALPAIDSSSAPPGSDPVKLGSSNIVTFTPGGTSSAGSLYILGPHNIQYAIRVFGETGKTRVLKFDLHARRWKPL
jgi:type II secretory pathway pseudopilin PulG